jgi:hypothetical protein
MSVTLAELKSALAAEGVTFFQNEDDGTILFSFLHDGQLLNVFVELLEDGEYLRWRIPYLLCLKDAEQRPAVLERLLQRNLLLKLVKFCFDPETGEISAEIAIPLEEGQLCANVVTRCVYVICEVVGDERTALLEMIRTGRYPQSEQERIDDAVARLLENDGDGSAPDGSADADEEPRGQDDTTD